MTALTLLAIWLLVGLFTAIVVLLTAEPKLPDDAAGVLGLLIVLGPVGSFLIVESAFRRWRVLRRERKLENQELRKAQFHAFTRQRERLSEKVRQ